MEDNKIIRLNKNCFKKREKTNSSKSRGYALFNEGMCFCNQEDKDDLALEKFHLAEKEGFVSADMFSYMAYLYGSVLNDNNKAEYYANKSISIDEEYGYPYRLLALVYENDYEKSLEYNLFAEKYGYDFNPSMMRHISELYTKIKKNNQLKAIEYATKAIDLDSKDCFNYYFKGWIYYNYNDWENAIKYFKKAEDKGYIDSDFYFEVSYANGELGNHEKAVEYANKCIFMDKDGVLGYYRRGYAYLLWEKQDKALETFLIAEKKNCNYADMYSRMAWLYSMKHEWDKSLEYVHKAQKFNKKEADAYYIESRIYGITPYLDFKKSLKLLKKARKLYENMGGRLNEESFLYLAILYSFLKKNKLALQSLDEALGYYSEDKYLLLFKVYILQSLKKYDQAYELLDKYFASYDGDDDYINCSLAIIFYNKKEKPKDYDKIIGYLEKVQEDDNFEKFGILGYCFYDKKDYEKSLEYMYEYANKIDLLTYENTNQSEFKKYVRRLVKKFGKDEKRLKYIINKFSIEIK